MTVTLAHVLISLAGIASGLVVLYGFVASRRLPGWTAVFLATTILTSATGFLFPFVRFLPSHAFGILTLVVLPVAMFGLYARRLEGGWRSVYVVGAVLAQYLNVFVLVVQSFRNVRFLSNLAPTQSEPPFAIAQLALLAAFIVIGVAAVRRFHPERASRFAPSQPVRPYASSNV